MKNSVVFGAQVAQLFILFFITGCLPLPFPNFGMPRPVLVYPAQEYTPRTSRLWQDVTGEYRRGVVYGLAPWQMTPTFYVRNNSPQPAVPAFPEIDQCGEEYRKACEEKLPCELPADSLAWETCGAAYEKAAEKVGQPTHKQHFASLAARWRLEQARRQPEGEGKQKLFAKVGALELQYRLR